jgi:NodT family efflux transporter outer membrane factor (OMF) lipoprotein
MSGQRPATSRHPAAIASAALLLAGCTAGPDFKRPVIPEGASYTTAPLSSTAATAQVAGGAAQQFVSGLDIPGEWWTLYRSPALNALVERALKNNPDLKAARAALTVAHENVLAQRGAYYPTIAAGISADRSKTSAQLAPVPNSSALLYSLYTPQVSVSYVPDVFGLNRRTVESLYAQEQGTHFQLAAAHISLSANVVAAAIQEASVRAQIEATRELIALNSNVLQVLRQQFTHGYANRLDVAAQEAQLAQVNATLPPLLKQLRQQRDLLAALSGSFPNQEPVEQFQLAQLQLPQELPISLPSRLIEQRPDVRQAEENLHAACAQIGVAVANRLPNITLTGDIGASALTISQLASAGSGFWDLGASVVQPVFQGGALLHKERAARAAYEQAREQYRSTVLVAFQNVADTLSALEHDADGLQATTAARDAAQTTLDLVRSQQLAGYAGYLQLLNAEQNYQLAVLSQVQAEASRYADTAALFQALGGGWWNRSDVDTAAGASHAVGAPVRPPKE